MVDKYILDPFLSPPSVRGFFPVKSSFVLVYAREKGSQWSLRHICWGEILMRIPYIGFFLTTMSVALYGAFGVFYLNSGTPKTQPSKTPFFYLWDALNFGFLNVELHFSLWELGNRSHQQVFSEFLQTNGHLILGYTCTTTFLWK